MTVFNDPASSVSDRLRDFLAESRSLDISPLHAITIGTVSINESAATFRMQRVTDVLPPDCYPARPILLLEKGNPTLNGIQRIPLPASWMDDDEIILLMDAMGWRNGDQATAEFAAPDSLGRPNGNMVSMVDFLIDRRKVEALGAFSVGPTQVNLALSGMAGGNMPWFETIEQFWRFWTARSLKAQYNSGVWEYLNTPNFPLSERMVQCGDAADTGCIELWLQNNQTGKRNWASARQREYAARFIKNRDLVFALAREVGYI